MLISGYQRRILMLFIIPVIEILGHLMSNVLSNDSLINYLNKVSFFDELILVLLLFIVAELLEYHAQMKTIEEDILNNINRNNDSIEDNNASIRKNNDGGNIIVYISY